MVLGNMEIGVNTAESGWHRDRPSSRSGQHLRRKTGAFVQVVFTTAKVAARSRHSFCWLHLGGSAEALPGKFRRS